MIYLISLYTNFNEYKNLSLLNKKINKLLLKNIPYYIKKEFAINNLSEYPDKLLELINPIKLYKIPIFKIINYYNIDYIDFLKKDNFNNKLFIRGIDKYNRPFISFYFKEEKKVTTLFQRYTNDKYRWVSGGSLPFESGTIVIDFDNYYKEDENIKFFIDYFNNN